MSVVLYSRHYFFSYYLSLCPDEHGFVINGNTSNLSGNLTECLEECGGVGGVGCRIFLVISCYGNWDVLQMATVGH